MSSSNVAVFGLGYVGCVSAACLAELGHHVTGVDRDPHKVQNVREGKAPFYEPGLEEIVQSNVSAGRLRATDSAAEGIAASDIALVCVGTPSERNGNIGLEQPPCAWIIDCAIERPRPVPLARPVTIG